MPPIRHVDIQNRDETSTMIDDEKMRYLMNDYVVEVLDIFLGKFKVGPDCSLLVVTTSPLGLHLLNEEAVKFNLELTLPFVNQRRSGLPQFVSVPAI